MESWKRFINEGMEQESFMILRSLAMKNVFNAIQYGAQKERWMGLGYSEDEWEQVLKPTFLKLLQSIKIEMSNETPTVEGKRPHGMYNPETGKIVIYPQNIINDWQKAVEKGRVSSIIAKKSQSKNIQNSITEEIYHYLDQQAKFKPPKSKGVRPATTASTAQEQLLRSLMIPWEEFVETLSEEEKAIPGKIKGWRQQYNYVVANLGEIYAKSKALRTALGGTITPRILNVLCKRKIPSSAGLRDLLRFMDCRNLEETAKKLNAIASAARIQKTLKIA